jgi:uncharacterized protein (DUF2384 family)
MSSMARNTGGRRTAAKKAAAKTVQTGRAVQAGKKDTPARKARKASKATRTNAVSRKWQPESRARFVSQVAGGTRRAADLLDVAPSQPSRWARGDSVPGPVQARMLVDLDHVLAHALLVWADERVARDWLTTPNAHLDGVRPLEWIRLHGTAEVVDALRAEAAGAYA